MTLGLAGLGDAELVALWIGHDRPGVSIASARLDLSSPELDKLAYRLHAVLN